MSERNEIKPAMTPEEWKAGKVVLRPPKQYDEGHGFEFYNDGDDVLWVYDGSWAVTASGGLRHQIAAACLRGQAFGFDWEDVDDERRAAAELVESAKMCERTAPERVPEYRARAARHEDRANRIAQLLPPRETETKP